MPRIEPLIGKEERERLAQRSKERQAQYLQELRKDRELLEKMLEEEENPPPSKKK